MQVIPVIDIRKGAVVRAIAGRREEYRPIETPLAASSAPLDVARGLMSLYPFKTLYIADLDAIEGRVRHRDERRDDAIRRRDAAAEPLRYSKGARAIEAIVDAFPTLRVWVDAGFTDRQEALSFASSPCVDPVVGSENCLQAATAGMSRDDDRVILSLDFLGERFLGDARLRDDEALWPQRLIVMTLSQVGSKAGPDIDRVREVVRRAGERRVYAAGGVRGLDDLYALKEAGAAGALVATALHDGRLTREDLGRLAQK